MNELIEYLISKFIPFGEYTETKIEIAGRTYEIVAPDEDGRIFSPDFALTNDFYTDCEFYVYKFGGVWYSTPKGTEDEPEMTELKYLGKSISQSNSFVGIHGGYEILNGSGEYYEYFKKARFLGCKRIAVTEKDSLSSAIKVQLLGKKYNIQTIVGANYSIYRTQSNIKYQVKVLVQNEEGWSNILKLNYHANILNEKFIYENDFFDCLDGLVVILDPKSIDFENIFPIDLHLDEVLYCYDPVIYTDQDRAQWYVNNLYKFHKSKHTPLPISDCFYLEPEMSHVKKMLNINSGKHEYFATNQYLKNPTEFKRELSKLTQKPIEEVESFVDQMYEKQEEILDTCNFNITIGEKYLPKYIMTPEEKKEHGTNEDMFLNLVEKGFIEKGLPDRSDEEVDQIEKEIEIIDYGHLRDYFLINYEEVEWCRKNDILTGFGRGSAPSFLVTYLLGITKVHPFEYNLIAERFLTKERAKHKIADIDIDVMQAKRDDVKNHLIEKYGSDQCCSVGTIGSFRISSSIKAIARIFNIDFQEVNKFTSNITLKIESFRDLFELIMQKSSMRSFVKKYPEIFRDMPYLLGARASLGVHASAFIITPQDKKVWEWMPIRKAFDADGKMFYVSEWEGYDLEEVGFLKQDILGLKQLDKFKMTADLVKSRTGEIVPIYDIPLDDKECFRYCANGWNADVFQFGSKSLSAYCKQLQPTSINDQIAAVALYRPGTIENNFHNEYVLRKKGEREVNYISGTESILSDTYGLMVYQEHIMAICQKLGGFDLAETDEVRRALGKKKLDVIAALKDKFLAGTSERGFDFYEMSDLWDMMVKFSGYSFNKSHSVVYAITGYKSLYDKVHYPIEFWTTTLSFADEKAVAGYLSEIYQTGDIKILPPDVNLSGNNMITDYKSNSIYWALTSIKGVGEKAVEQLLADRNEFGKYFSISEFVDRHKKNSAVNKTVTESLIMSGAFDYIEKIESPKDRIVLLEKYRDTKKTKKDKEAVLTVSEENAQMNWWWILQQKRLSGIAFFDFALLIKTYHMIPNFPFFDSYELSDPIKNKRSATVGGYVSDIETKVTKKGTIAKITLDCNYVFVLITIWADDFTKYSKFLGDLKGKLLLVNGAISYDSYNEKNSLSFVEKSEITILS